MISFYLPFLKEALRPLSFVPVGHPQFPIFLAMTLLPAQVTDDISGIANVSSVQ